MKLTLYHCMRYSIMDDNLIKSFVKEEEAIDFMKNDILKTAEGICLCIFSKIENNVDSRIKYLIEEGIIERICEDDSVFKMPDTGAEWDIISETIDIGEPDGKA